MISRDDATYSLRICDVDTICMGFDLDVLQHLYWEFFGKKAPSTWDAHKLASQIKGVIEDVDRAAEEVKRVGISSEEDALKFLSTHSVKSLISDFSKDFLRSMYLYVFKSRPLSVYAGIDMAEALIGYYKSVRRSEALLAEPDGKGLSVSELQSRYPKQQLIKMWERLYKIKCNKRRAEDVAWDIWSWYADEERTRDLTKMLR